MKKIYLVIEDDALCQLTLPIAAFESEKDASYFCEKWNAGAADQMMSYYFQEVDLYPVGENNE